MKSKHAATEEELNKKLASALLAAQEESSVYPCTSRVFSEIRLGSMAITICLVTARQELVKAIQADIEGTLNELLADHKYRTIIPN